MVYLKNEKENKGEFLDLGNNCFPEELVYY
jgi:hypothetical protein